MCIEQLPLEMRKRYEELVIFREDVNITPQVQICDFNIILYLYIKNMHKKYNILNVHMIINMYCYILYLFYRH